MKRFDVFLVNLDPTQGREIKKTRPAAIVSPNEMNDHISTVIIAPMTTKGRDYPTRVSCDFQGKRGQIILDMAMRLDKGCEIRNYIGVTNAASGLRAITMDVYIVAEGK